MLLFSLPTDFQNFVVAMETRDELSKFSLLKQKFLEEGKRRKEKVGNDHAVSSLQQQAFTAKTTNKSKDKKYNKKFKGKCFYVVLLVTMQANVKEETRKTTYK